MRRRAPRQCFNTQPPEGGWPGFDALAHLLVFQHTAARRRLAYVHSLTLQSGLFQHTAARRRLLQQGRVIREPRRFQHTAARRRLLTKWLTYNLLSLFQHTAARRRLAGIASAFNTTAKFQHTAARRRLRHRCRAVGAECGFNTQPPEGGCIFGSNRPYFAQVSTHSRPKAAENPALPIRLMLEFQHTAARRRLPVRWLGLVQTWVSTHSRPKAAEPLSKALLHQVSQPRFR